MSGIPLVVAEEVADALAEGRAVVALESNVITHGLPYPDNAATAVKVESAARAGGAVRSPHRIDDPDLLARVVGYHWAAGARGSVVR